MVVAPIGTKPLLGGSMSNVPAGTRSGFLILLISTKRGADRLKRWAIWKRVSPGCTVYERSGPVVVGAPVVEDPTAAESDGPDEPVEPSVSRLEITARKAKMHVLHRR